MTDDDCWERDDWSREQYEDEIADGLQSEPDEEEHDDDTDE